MFNYVSVSCRRAILLPLILVISISTRAQITGLDDTTMPPTPGVGHDYVKMLGETVNPANGSVSIRIDLPIPKGRGLDVPFAILYSSSGPQHVIGNSNGGGVWGTDTGQSSGSGWSYSIPTMTVVQGIATSTISGPPPTTYSCYYYYSYVMRDWSGAAHPFTLQSAQNPADGTTGCNLSTNQPSSNLSSTIDFYQAITTVPSNVFLPPPVTVVDPDATVYSFSPGANVQSYNNVTSYWGAANQIEDRNGNLVTAALVQGPNGVASGTIQDTAGRSISVSAVSNNSNNISITGLAKPYVITWESVPSNFSVTSTPVGSSPCTGIGIAPNTGSNYVIKSITLPNLHTYQFEYNDAYGLLSQITYPDGGFVRYSWNVNSQSEFILLPAPPSWNMTCGTVYDSPAIAERQVSYDGTNIAETQTFNYAAPNGTVWSTTNPYTWISKQTTVTTSDGVRGSFSTTYKYAPMLASPEGSAQAPVEQKILYSDFNGNTLKTVYKNWQDLFLLSCELEQRDNSLISADFYTYGLGGQITDEKEYDYGLITSTSACNSAAPSNPTRETVAAYQSFNAVGAYEAFSGTPGPLVDKPCKKVVYDGNGKPFSETDYLYDSGSIICGNPGIPSVSSAGGSFITGHDSTNYGVGSTISRGNVTTKIQRLFGSSASPMTTYTYDETGHVTSKTDANGNVTQYSYGDQFLSTNTGGYTTTAGSPPAGYVTNAYLTSITRPATTTKHIESFTYGYNNGEVTTSADENIPPNVTTYRYNDSLGRLTETDYPDQGQTTLTYNDAAPSPSVTTTKKQTSTTNIASMAIMDGLGHLIQTQLSAPEGPLTNETTYTGMGWVNTRTNPHRSTASSTDGTTSYSYDALGRTLSVKQADGSSVTTKYATSCAPNANAYGTTVTDEAGKVRTTCTDALGRLVNVFEDPSGLNYETDYQYDVLGNLLNVTQKGGSAQANWRVRNFVYDSLSRLTSATNPESGTVLYSYDPNGNLISKQDARGIQTTMKYDVLNRLLSKSYSDGTPTATFYYDTPPVVWGSGIKNVNGRLVEATTGVTPEP